MAEATDEILMSNVKAGQLSDLAGLFDRYNVLLYNFFLKLTGEPAASEDLTQNLFYRIIRYRHTFNIDQGSFKSWVYQMARNQHADYYKTEKKISELFTQSGEEMESIPAREGDEEDYQRLRVALGKLGAVERELIVLSRYQGLKYSEIAKMKDSTVGAIKVQIHRAIKQLRNLYFNDKASL
ncbi:MAG TPA: RNA polymerase sigma factor [Chitinophagaceae bacterium]|nr:RNA polymerase sigma factor [Chitinophagaceae bacterium]